MELPDSIEVQAQLSMRHLMRILQVYNLTADHIVQLVCYISSQEYYDIVKHIWSEQTVDLSTQKMLNCVVMPRLPKNAGVEWHAVATQQLPKTEYLENQYSVKIHKIIPHMTFSTTKYRSIENQDFESDNIVVYYSETSEDFAEMLSSSCMLKNQTQLFPVEYLAEPDVKYFANSRKIAIDSS